MSRSLERTFLPEISWVLSFSKRHHKLGQFLEDWYLIYEDFRVDWNRTSVIVVKFASCSSSMVSMEINKTLIVQESDPKMATASQQRPLALLRRPLPPKQDLPPSSFRTGSEAKYSQTDSNYKVSAKSPDVLSAKRLVNVKSTKVVDSTLREVRFHGDVPLPVSSVVKPYKTKGPDLLPSRPPRKPRELPSEAFIKDSYARPPPEFTLKHFLRRLPSRANPDDQVEPMVSEQNFEKLTSWFAANKPHQATVHSLQIDSE